jgi:hypothetical protein
VQVTATTWRSIKAGNFMGICPREYTEAITNAGYLRKQVAIPGPDGGCKCVTAECGSRGSTRRFKTSNRRGESLQELAEGITRKMALTVDVGARQRKWSIPQDELLLN